ncbi:MAG: YhbY family RNA-binding protein [Candidatus Bathyarchaeales archaeon]
MSKLTAGMKRRIKREMTQEKPTVWVGKSGVSKDLITEIEKQLEQREMVKVKILKSALDENKANAIASSIADQTGATLVEIRGHTLVLYKRREKRFKPPK